MADQVVETAASNAARRFGGAVGVGLVLVLLPAIALFFGIKWLEKMPIVGLPLLSIFGIMMLFGALALVATLFARLKLEDRTQALALPEGSIRAVIALALIVLFAIIAIMLFQSTSAPYKLDGLTDIQKDKILNDPLNAVYAVVTEPCKSKLADCVSYTVHLVRKPPQESSDLAKQLLILIGTLMTSVTSFYFGSRASTPSLPAEPAPAQPVKEIADGDVSNPPVTSEHATPDEALPPATGGVAS